MMTIPKVISLHKDCSTEVQTRILLSRELDIFLWKIQHFHQFMPSTSNFYKQEGDEFEDAIEKL